MFDTLTKIFQALQGFFKSDRGSFIAAILGHWYLLILAPTLAITYYFFKGLQESGLMLKAEIFIQQTLGMLVGYARDCFPLIGNLRDFLSCFN